MRSSKEIRQYFDLLPCDVQITKQRIMKDLKIGELQTNVNHAQKFILDKINVKKSK